MLPVSVASGPRQALTGVVNPEGAEEDKTR